MQTWVQSLDWEDPLRRERLPTSVFWPREFHGLCSPWVHKESDMTEWFSLSLFLRVGKSAYRLLHNDENWLFKSVVPRPVA